MGPRYPHVASLRATCRQRADAQGLAGAVRNRYPDAVVVIDEAVVHVMLPGLQPETAWGAVAALIADLPLPAASATGAAGGA